MALLLVYYITERVLKTLWLRGLVLSRAKNSGRQCHFKIWLDCHKLKKCPCLIMPMSTKCQKIGKRMTISVIQHDDRLLMIFTTVLEWSIFHCVKV
jgi:hypothetical protein